MKVKFGSIVTAGSGKIGGHVASRGRAGAYMRTKVTPTNRRTTAQQSVRNRLATIAAGWKALTDAQRNAWNTAVAAFSKTNIFGDKVQPSGINLYQAVNNGLSQAGQSLVTVPPSPVALPLLTNLTLLSDASDATMTLDFDSSIGSGFTYRIQATPALSAGISNAASKFADISTLSAAPSTPANIKAAYEAKFGSIPAAGKKVFVRVIAVSNTSGQIGVPAQTSAIVAV